ncbi:MAG: NUDIX domain-containing protein [Bacteroidota bacterium]
MPAKIIDKLAWIHLVDYKILSTRSKGKTKFYIPGGKRELGESDVAALTREIKEELTVDLVVEGIQFLGNFQAQADSHAEGVEVLMQCYTADYQGEIRPAAEIAEIAWLTNADRDKIAPVDQLIFDFLVEKGLLR